MQARKASRCLAVVTQALLCLCTRESHLCLAPEELALLLAHCGGSAAAAVAALVAVLVVVHVVVAAVAVLLVVVAAAAAAAARELALALLRQRRQRQLQSEHQSVLHRLSPYMKHESKSKATKRQV